MRALCAETITCRAHSYSPKCLGKKREKNLFLRKIVFSEDAYANDFIVPVGERAH